MRHTIPDSVAHTFTGHLKDVIPLSTPFDHVVRAMLWNQIEAAMSIMLNKPTLMMIHNSVPARGLFERGAANVFVHQFHTLGRKWISDLKPKLAALREAVMYNR